MKEIFYSNRNFIFLDLTYVKTRALEWEGQSLEPYQILVSQTDDDFGSFVILGELYRQAPADQWDRVTVDLSQFDGKAVYVAIRYVGRPNENVVLMVDDISVLTGLNSVDTAALDGIKISCDGDTIKVAADSDIENITIHDIFGREVLSTSPRQSHLEISTNKLSSGMYLISALTLYGHKTIKFYHRQCCQQHTLQN